MMLPVCSALFSGAALVLDVTAGGWTFAQETAAAHGIPYVRVQVSNYQWIAATDHLLQSRNATDAALIFGSEAGGSDETGGFGGCSVYGGSATGGTR